MKKYLFIRLSSLEIVDNCHIRNPRPPFELGYLISIANNCNCQTKLIDLFVSNKTLGNLMKETFGFAPDVIVLSVLSFAVKLSLNFAETVKRRLYTEILVVGQHATARPEDFIFDKSPIDLCIAGEPEVPFLGFVQSNSRFNEIRNLKSIYSLYNRNKIIHTVENLDALPFFPHHLFMHGYNSYYSIRAYKKLKWGYMLTSRGCPHSCIFCSTVIRESYGQNVRLRSPDSVMKEIEYLVKLGVNIITFCDDNFTALRNHVKGICAGILRRNINISWIIHARIDNLDDSLMAMMKKAGCVLLRVGIESSSDRLVKVLRKTSGNFNWANRTREVFYMAKRIGLPINAFFIVGIPTSTYKEVLKDIQFAREINPDLLNVHFFTPYPGSRYYEMNKEAIRYSNVENLYHYQLSINLSEMPFEKLNTLQRDFYRKFYCRFSFIAKHLYHYFLFYIFNLKITMKLSQALISILYGKTERRDVI